MLGDLLEGMYERRSWLEHRIHELNTELVESDPEYAPLYAQEIKDKETELDKLNDRIHDFHRDCES